MTHHVPGKERDELSRADHGLSLSPARFASAPLRLSGQGETAASERAGSWDGEDVGCHPPCMRRLVAALSRRSTVRGNPLAPERRSIHVASMTHIEGRPSFPDPWHALEIPLDELTLAQ